MFEQAKQYRDPFFLANAQLMQLPSPHNRCNISKTGDRKVLFFSVHSLLFLYTQFNMKTSHHVRKRKDILLKFSIKVKFVKKYIFSFYSYIIQKNPNCTLDSNNGIII